MLGLGRQLRSSLTLTPPLTSVKVALPEACEPLWGLSSTLAELPSRLRNITSIVWI